MRPVTTGICLVLGAYVLARAILVPITYDEAAPYLRYISQDLFAVFSFEVATNHFLNPLTETNDPLANTLSVTAPHWLEHLHLQFGYHVEHHLFPTVSGRHAPAVRDVLRRLYGDRYLSMPHVQALRLLYARPKIHDGHDVLIDPRTRERFAVLAAGNASMAKLAGT